MGVIEQMPCPCCGREHFSGLSGFLADESHWKSKYGYSVKLEEVDSGRFGKILRHVRSNGLDELEGFFHFLSWRYELYCKKEAQQHNLNLRLTISDALKHRNKCGAFLNEKRTEHQKYALERTVKYDLSSDTKAVQKGHDLWYNQTMQLWECKKCKLWSKNKSELEKSTCKS